MIPSKILLVEDEESLRKVLRDKLEMEGFEVFEASDGQMGLDKAMEVKPNLILLDIVMPIMDGLTMATKLREREKEAGQSANNHTKIILLTNLGDEENMAKAQTQGIYNYLIKSNWKIEDLVKRIKEEIS
jgi:two-component system response regulator ResD